MNEPIGLPAEVIKFPNDPCPFCRKNEATQLCDFVTDYLWTSAKDNRGRMIGPTTITCDNPSCKSCMTNSK